MMKPVSETSSLRERIIYGLMSAFVAWHTLAIMVGPAPRDSDMARALRPLIDPYLNLIYLNVDWGFFAPVGMTFEIHYKIENAAGKTHNVYPTRGMTDFHPSTLWTKDHLRGVAEGLKNEGAKQRIIAGICTRYVAMKPVKITIVETKEEKYFAPTDYLAGKKVLDKEFASVEILGAGVCPKAQ
jgi:hypothetical protein